MQTRTDWDAPSDTSENQCDSPVRYRPTNCHGNQYQKVGSDWGAMAAGQIDTYSDRDRHSRGSYSPYSNGSSHYRPTHHTRDVGTRMSPKRKCCHRVEPIEDKYVTLVLIAGIQQLKIVCTTFWIALKMIFQQRMHTDYVDHMVT